MQLQVGEKEQDFALAPIQVSISVQLWRLPGCHEFLAALGRQMSLERRGILWGAGLVSLLVLPKRLPQLVLGWRQAEGLH